MAITGYLSEFSVPEIFQFVGQGYKTGLLSIQPQTEATQRSARQFAQRGEPPHATGSGEGSGCCFEQAPQQGKIHYLWLQEGRITAAADQLDNKHLLLMLKQRGWLSPEVLSVVQEWSKVEQPLGLYLKAQGAISAEQLKLLFHAQVIQRVCALFKLSNGQFAFDAKAKLPTSEMTGLSLSANEATLLGLRVLRDWTALAEKLPDKDVGLVKAIAGAPRLQLDVHECQLWGFADSSVSINEIAIAMQLPVETIQKIAFRMIVVGLLEEAPIIAPEITPPVAEKVPVAVAANSGANLNKSFLDNLVGFLKTKVA